MFITFEGIDGAGKTTQIDILVKRLQSAGEDVVVTREPGGTKIGNTLRGVLLDVDNHDMSVRTEVLLYAASRAQLVDTVIEPALSAGRTVICDRYVDASLAYQGAGLGVGVAEVRAVNAFATRGLRPDLTFLFDLPVEVAMERVASGQRAVPSDRIERRGAAYFERVRTQFLAIASEEPNRVVIINALLPVEQLQQEIWRHFSKFTQNRRRVD